jgi:hypothetical protein
MIFFMGITGQGQDIAILKRGFIIFSCIQGKVSIGYLPDRKYVPALPAGGLPNITDYPCNWIPANMKGKKMKINPFWAAAFVMLMMIVLLNFDSLLKSAQDLDASVQEHVRNSLRTPRSKSESVVHSAELFEGSQGSAAGQLPALANLRKTALLTGIPFGLVGVSQVDIVL